jgi:putative transposase
MVQVHYLNEQGVPVQTACQALGVPRSSYYVGQSPKQPAKEPSARKPSPRRLSEVERSQMKTLLNSDRFLDQSPREVYATLLDEETYIGSVSTMYRLLREHDQVRERRNQRRHPAYSKPELLAQSPNQLWSWDITKLKSHQKWVYYYLYVMLDVFSRYVVGWMIAEQESADLGQQLIRQSYENQGITPGELTIHADRGSPMIALTTAQLLQNLGVAKTHSRPYTSSDNPFSEAHFKTMKYRPEFPTTFGSVQDARGWGRHFFPWYNEEHHHTGLQLLTPATVHYGQSDGVIAQRNLVLADAYEKHPERFVKGLSVHPVLPTMVWINPPASLEKETDPT